MNILKYIDTNDNNSLIYLTSWNKKFLLKYKSWLIKVYFYVYFS